MPRCVSFIRRFDGEANDAFVPCLGKHIADVKADGPLADSQLAGNFLIGQVTADELQDIQFPLGQGDTMDTKFHGSILYP